MSYLGKHRYDQGGGLKKLRIASRFRIDQRKIDPISGESYEPIFTKISIFLGTKKVNYRNIKGREYLNVSASSVKSIKILKIICEDI